MHLSGNREETARLFQILDILDGHQIEILRLDFKIAQGLGLCEGNHNPLIDFFLLVQGLLHRSQFKTFGDQRVGLDKIKNAHKDHPEKNNQAKN
jgi:hypothetical protein